MIQLLLLSLAVATGEMLRIRQIDLLATPIKKEPVQNN